MEQQPISGYAPLDPPDAALAQAYLAEVDAVGARRDERIDRRAMARLHFINAAVLFVYVTACTLSSRAEGSAGIILLIVPLLVWTQLQGELRESYGYQARLRGASLAWYLGGFAVIIGAFLALMALDAYAGGVPLPLLFVPGALAAAIFIVLGARGRRAAASADSGESIAGDTLPFTRGARLLTAGIGLGLGLIIAAYGMSAEFAVVAWGACMLGLAGIVVWMLAAQTGSAVPALGWMWRAPQWTVFALSGAALALIAVLPAFGVVLHPFVPIIVPVVIVVLHTAVAFLGGRRAG